MAFIVGDLVSANQQSQASKGILNAQTASSEAALAEAKRQFDLGRADQQPWLDTGKGALSILANQYGIGANGAVNPAGGNTNAFMASPDYQFRQDEQARALTARNAALGIQDSGAAQKSAMKLSGNLASGEYSNWYNRLAGLAGTGQTTATNLAGQGSNYAQQFGNITQQQGQNLASSYQRKADINSNSLGKVNGYLDSFASLLTMGL